MQVPDTAAETGHRFPVVFHLSLLLCVASVRAADVPIVQAADAPANERLAAQDLAIALDRVYPQDHFSLATNLPVTGNAILVGEVSHAPMRAFLATNVPATPESFIVRTQLTGGLELGLIAGADSRGTAQGVYQLLTQLGCGFHLSGDTMPAPKTNAFNFTGWKLDNAPLARQRLIFNWHNFLSGCSTWNLSDWEKWTVQAQKMGFNAIMVHAYGNNPMAAFPFQGQARPAGYLSTTVKGRDWSTMHVNDVRRLFGGEVFDGPVFGSDAAMVPDDQRVAAAQALMQQVFKGAAQRNLDVYFAVDVDTPSANPQELVRLLPESARFKAPGSTGSVAGKSAPRVWVPNPDTPEGRAFYRAQVAGLMQAYPQITTLVAWFRRGGTPWMELKTNDLPTAWRKEYAGEIAGTPAAGQYWHAPGLFAMGKIVRAFEDALKECGATQTRVAAGSWCFDFLPGADRFFPAGVPLIALDYNVIAGKSQLRDAPSRAQIREVSSHRPVIVVAWAQHDDGRYLGRPFTPLPEFASKLEDANAAGFGVIHWTTRPLDLYFESLAKQVWQGTKDQSLPETCREFAERCYGAENRAAMGEYLEAWIADAPQFGRETGDWLVDHKLTNITSVIAGCHTRLALMDQVQSSGLTPEQPQQLAYQRGLEQFIAAFYEAQGCFQDSEDLLRQGDVTGARKLMAKCHPETVIEQFARLGSIGGISRGEQGLVVTLNTRWLSHIVSHRQALGLEPVRINFAATSHDPLAQSPGAFTFHFEVAHELWETWGERETGATVISLPPAPANVANASLPAAWDEVGRCGIEIAKPLTLTLAPIMAPDNRGREKSLAAGDYRLHLLVRDPNSTATGQGELEVKIANLPTDRVDVFDRAGGNNRVVDLLYSVALKAAGKVEVALTPITGKAVLCGAVLEPIAALIQPGR